MGGIGGRGIPDVHSVWGIRWALYATERDDGGCGICVAISDSYTARWDEVDGGVGSVNVMREMVMQAELMSSHQYRGVQREEGFQPILLT